MTPVLDFAALDGLGFASERGRLKNSPPPFVAHDIGPLMEFVQLAASGLLPSPDQGHWLNVDGLKSLHVAVTTGQSYWVCPDGGRIGVLRTAARPPERATVSIGFCLAAQKAAIAAGFPAQIARQLAACIEEMHSNIYEHSAASATGLISFRAVSNRFEFVVLDRGIGVLDSLRTCDDYNDVRDHGSALRLVLKDGVSRHGGNAGRGYGFRPLFVGLSNLRGSLRFRSGDHALLMDGANRGLATARVSQKPYLKGFLISVVCENARSF